MQLPDANPYSYWELKHYFRQFDLIVIGSGIVGLSTAISFKQKNTKASVLVLERGILPDGASTKNAGFACFGSASELMDDLKNTAEENVWNTVKMRWDGLALLRKRLGDRNMDFKALGGYELFDDQELFNQCLDATAGLNKKMQQVLGLKDCYAATQNIHRFKTIKGGLFNQYEGQIDTSKMMKSLIFMAHRLGIEILNNIAVTAINDVERYVELSSAAGIFKASTVVVATNGFAAELLGIKDVVPARAQVLITKPVRGLKIEGTYHYQQGYYYFRNIDQRILFGGGRNLDFETENTTAAGFNPKIQQELDRLLKEMILPGIRYEVEHRWTGIMGVGKEKSPIIKPVSPNVLAAVRMGGMGIAIGSWVGEKAASSIAR
jgi:gamma-glutamylputrescine oxidase